VRLVEGTASVADVDAFVADLAAIGDEHGCTVQAFDARYVADREHLETALRHADRAFERGENVARDRGVEVLCYAAGRRQIDRALAMGVEEGETPAVVLVAAEETDGDATAADASRAEDAAAEAVAARLESGPGLDATDEERVREFFEVGDAELAATDAGLAALVAERVALLDVEK